MRSHASKFFPGQPLAAARALPALFDPLVQARQVKVRFILPAPAVGGHARVGRVEPLHADDALVPVALQCLGLPQGHLLLQVRSRKHHFVISNYRYVSRGVEARSLPKWRGRWRARKASLEQALCRAHRGLRPKMMMMINSLQRVVRSPSVPQASDEGVEIQVRRVVAWVLARSVLLRLPLT